MVVGDIFSAQLRYWRAVYFSFFACACEARVQHAMP